MDWENSPFSDASSECSSCSDNQDADDEQSDWPGYNDKRDRSATLTSTSTNFLAPSTKCPMSNNVQKKIERFLYDSEQKELVLHQVYKTSNVWYLFFGD